MSSPAPAQLERPSHTGVSRELIWSREAFGRGDTTSSDSEFEFTVINLPSATTRTRQDQHPSSPSNTFEAVNDFTRVNGVSPKNAVSSLRNTSSDGQTPRPEPQSHSEDSDADDEDEDLKRLITEGGGDHFRNPNGNTRSHIGARTNAATARKRKQEDRDAAAAALENERIAASVGSVNKLAPKERAAARLRVAGMDGGRDGEMALRAMMDVDGDGKRKRKRTCRAMDG